MRMCLKVEIDNEAGNSALRDGSLPKLMQSLQTELKPEAAYFTTDQGNRTAFFYFNMTDSAQIPSIAEPLFMGLKAKLTLTPVMNGEELAKGLEAWKKKM